MNGEIKASNGVDIDGVGSLAGLVEEDIQRRGLMPGDRYLYAKDVAKLFGVNEMMAHRGDEGFSGRAEAGSQSSAWDFCGAKVQVCRSGWRPGFPGNPYCGFDGLSA